MNPSRRSRLREQLRERARAQDWAALVAEHGTPLLVLDPRVVVERYRLLQQHLPGFRLHYAVKAQPHPAVVRAIAGCGGWFDVASRAEIDHLVALGIPMHRCIHMHPVKKPPDIDHALAAGVELFVVDNRCEVAKFVGRAADVRILVRVAFANPTAKSDLSAKFGVDPAEAELLAKDVVAAGVRFAGLSFHVGSQSAGVEPFRRALSATAEIADELARTLGMAAPMLDIGGGFPVDYREPMPGIAAIGAVVDDVLGPDRGRFTLLAEPGRFVVAESATLLTSVVGSADRGGGRWHYLDDGVYGCYSNVMTEDVHPPILAWREMEDHTVALSPAVLAGPTCDSADVIARDYPLPPLDPGDVVLSPVMGAYTTVTASRFNGIAATPVVVV